MHQQLLAFVRSEALDNDDPSYDSDNQWLSRSDQSSPSSSSPTGAAAMRSHADGAQGQRHGGHPPHGLPQSSVLQRNNYLAAPTPIIQQLRELRNTQNQISAGTGSRANNAHSPEQFGTSAAEQQALMEGIAGTQHNQT